MPFLSIDRLSQVKNYYGQYTNTVVSVLKRDPYEVSLGLDNMKWFSTLEKLNIRFAVRNQVYPSYRFRLAELSGRWNIDDAVIVGMRGEIY
ncbi:MAG: hypothetical protein M0R68_08205 [Bacteroidetes bacterium]|nr:hypothetical protein [Bacteroidota bacterium]